MISIPILFDWFISLPAPSIYPLCFVDHDARIPPTISVESSTSIQFHSMHACSYPWLSMSLRTPILLSPTMVFRLLLSVAFPACPQSISALMSYCLFRLSMCDLVRYRCSFPPLYIIYKIAHRFYAPTSFFLFLCSEFLSNFLLAAHMLRAFLLAVHMVRTDHFSKLLRSMSGATLIHTAHLTRQDFYSRLRSIFRLHPYFCNIYIPPSKDSHVL